MKIIYVSFNLQIENEDDTDDEIQEWLEFELGANSSIKNTNPLVKESFITERYSVGFDEY